jgi:hypothetical protein
MKLLFDLDSSLVAVSGGLSQPITMLSIKRGPTVAIDVEIGRNGYPSPLVETDRVVFGVKTTKQYDDPEFITGALGIPNEDFTSYRIVFEAQNILIDEALNVNANLTDDVVSVDFMAEVLVETSAGEWRSQTFTLRILNNVIRGSEVVPGDTGIDYILDDTDPEVPEAMIGEDSIAMVHG